MTNKDFLVTTTNKIPGHNNFEILGIARGSTVRSKNLVTDIGAGFKNLVGGEVKSYTNMANQARDEAYNRMVNNAIEMGANAIVGMRFSTSMIMQGASEMVAFGTAIVVK